jgi:simple sugar transport system permease protein
MSDPLLARILGSIIAQSAPLMLAVTGETITERSGVINLSLDGSMMLSAMVGFFVAYESSNLLGVPGDTVPLLLGFAAAALVGAATALLVAWGSLGLKQNQVAIGFVLTLLLADLANFLGQNHTRIPGPSVHPFGIPVLKDIPILGSLFFDHDLLIYFTFLVVAAATWWLYQTQPGLRMRGVGERPEAAFVRGVNVNRVRYVYSALGGALIGLGGAAFSLDIKLGWSDNHILGVGWIALAIVIFGGWRPIGGALGAMLYGTTKYIATVLQQSYPDVPVVLFNSLQWLLMLGVLLLVSSQGVRRLIEIAPKPLQRPLARALRASPPESLGMTEK